VSNTHDIIEIYKDIGSLRSELYDLHKELSQQLYAQSASINLISSDNADILSSLHELSIFMHDTQLRDSNSTAVKKHDKKIIAAAIAVFSAISGVVGFLIQHNLFTFKGF
jgi:hypothetical protein